MGVVGHDKLAGLDMLVELGLELVGAAALELAELERVGPAGPGGIVGVAVLEAAELVAFVALGPDRAGLFDLPEPAPLPLAQLALGNGAEHCSKLHSSAKEVSEVDQSPD